MKNNRQFCPKWFHYHFSCHNFTFGWLKHLQSKVLSLSNLRWELLILRKSAMLTKSNKTEHSSKIFFRREEFNEGYKRVTRIFHVIVKWKIRYFYYCSLYSNERFFEYFKTPGHMILDRFLCKQHVINSSYFPSYSFTLFSISTNYWL